MKQDGVETRRNDRFVFPQGTLLLVGEDTVDLHHYDVVIRTSGYQVHTCGSYEEGVRLLNSGAFSLIIVSQGSPNFEGRCVLERAVQLDRSLPVLVLARSLEMPCYLEAMQLGAVDYLAEPITVQELRRVVETHIRPRPAIKEAALHANITDKRGEKDSLMS